MQHKLDLTIATTLDCNYSRFYCFEKKQKAYITEKVVNNIISRINQKQGLKHLHITWFGGEPLMAYDKIEYFNSKLNLPSSVYYTTNLITNGYYLTKDVILSLRKNKIDAIRLTLDGLKDSHNKRRRCKETKDTFTAVFNNIDTFMEHEKRYYAYHTCKLRRKKQARVYRVV
ncbi:MAG: radical SAM protein [Prevotellaceae bacterium]|nr:radical SAM protein [Prevotellaceae bacterium]